MSDTNPFSRLLLFLLMDEEVFNTAVLLDDWELLEYFSAILDDLYFTGILMGESSSLFLKE